MLVLERPKCFNIKDIFECGQVFRYTRISDNEYNIISKDQFANIKQDDKQIYIDSSNNEYFVNYLDYYTDYKKIINSIRDLPFIAKAVDNCDGTRILRQDKFETIISYIVSSNNNIPRIKHILNKLSENFGENNGEYYAFPSLEALVNVDINDFRKLGLGYRDAYLKETVKKISQKTIDIDKIEKLETFAARKELLKLSGVGSKVADCILLFGYYKLDVFPVDTWVKKIYFDIFKDDENNIKIIADRLVKLYGKNSGYAQQYLYYNKRIFEK